LETGLTEETQGKGSQVMIEGKRTMMEAKEAAEYLFISYDSILRWAKEGKIPHSRPGHRVLFCKETLDEWLADQESNSIKKPEPIEGYGKLRKIV
jgi:excisionase family DNA binding protein